MELIVLEELVDFLDDPETTVAAQREKYDE